MCNVPRIVTNAISHSKPASQCAISASDGFRGDEYTERPRITGKIKSSTGHAKPALSMLLPASEWHYKRLRCRYGGELLEHSKFQTVSFNRLELLV